MPKPNKKVDVPKEPPKPVAEAPQAKVAKRSANDLLQQFLIENRIRLLIDTLDKNIKTINDGSIIIGKPIVTAEYING